MVVVPVDIEVVGDWVVTVPLEVGVVVGAWVVVVAVPAGLVVVVENRVVAVLVEELLAVEELVLVVDSVLVVGVAVVGERVVPVDAELPEDVRDWVVVVAVPPVVAVMEDWVVLVVTVDAVLPVVIIGDWLVVEAVDPEVMLVVPLAVLPVVLVVGGWLVVLAVVMAPAVSMEVEGIKVVEICSDTNTDGRSIPNRRRSRVPVQPGIQKIENKNWKLFSRTKPFCNDQCLANASEFCVAIKYFNILRPKLVASVSRLHKVKADT